LITVGTPHQGSKVADEAQKVCRNTPLYLCSLADILPPGIDPFSTAITDLKSEDNPALEDLNNLTLSHHALPDTVSYVSIIGTGITNIVLTEDGDGIVSAFSQDL